LVLIFASFLSACATPDAQKIRQADNARAFGERFLREGQTSRALQQFLIALELNPDDPYLHYDLAYTYDRKGILDKAEFHLKEAVRLKPDYSSAHNFLGAIYFRTGRVELAIESYNKALSNLLYLSPQDARYNLGVAYLSLREYQKAAEQFELAIGIIPDYTAAYNNLGKAYEGLQDKVKARKAYEKALEFDPNFTEAHLNLGKLLYRSGDRRGATKSFKEVVRLAPKSDMAAEARRYLSRLK
jgi:Flp pilus assembly protein TadD